MTLLRRFWSCASGATAAEYALILAIIGTAFAAAALFLGGVIGDQMNDTGHCIQDTSTC